MGVGVSIPLNATGGGQAGGEVDKVTSSVHRLGAAEKSTANEARARGQAQQQANRHGHEGGVAGGLHALGRLRLGESSHIAHRLSAVASMGTAGVALGGLALIGNLVLSSVEHFHEQMVEGIKKARELDAKVYEATKRAGGASLGYANSQGLAIQGLSTAGVSDEAMARYQRMGLDPTGLTRVAGRGSMEAAARAAAGARRFGIDSNTALGKIGEMGGLRDGGDDVANAAMIAGLVDGRRRTADEMARARAKPGGYAGQIGEIQRQQGLVKGAEIEGVGSGAASGAQSILTGQATSPEAAAMSEAFKAATEKSDVLREIADNTHGVARLLERVESIFGHKTAESNYDSAAASDSAAFSRSGAAE